MQKRNVYFWGKSLSSWITLVLKYDIAAKAERKQQKHSWPHSKEAKSCRCIKMKWGFKQWLGLEFLLVSFKKFLFAVNVQPELCSVKADLHMEHTQEIWLNHSLVATSACLLAQRTMLVCLHTAAKVPGNVPKHHTFLSALEQILMRLNKSPPPPQKPGEEGNSSLTSD